MSEEKLLTLDQEITSAWASANTEIQIAVCSNHKWDDIENAEYLLADVFFNDCYIVSKETMQHNKDLVRKLKARIRELEN